MRRTVVPLVMVAATMSGCGEDDSDSACEDITCIIETTVQWGSSGEDATRGAAIDSDGSIYATGYAMGAIGDNTYAGSVDAFLTKLTSDGTETWTRQYGTPSWDQPFAVAVDGRGNVYITGGTFGDLEGNTAIANGDVFLTRFAADGTRRWTVLWGTGEEDIGYAVTVDSRDDIYVAGWTAGDLDGTCAGNTDVFLTKLSPDGTRLWTRQWGVDGFDSPAGATVDSQDNIYVTGHTHGALDGNPLIGAVDIFLTKFASDGTKAWTQQWGTDDIDSGKHVAVDSEDDVYVTGYINIYTTTNAADVFLTKLTPDGTELWTELWGSTEIENGWSVAVDDEDDIYVTGKTHGDLDGNVNAGGNCGDIPCSDIYLTKLTSDGTKLWTRQWGSNRNDHGSAVLVDGEGRAYVSGGTDGDLEGNTSFGDEDAFLTILSSEAAE
ncbi:MAG: SBBP repeat-containing protein [Deltaproteobacteria bacterium]|nr:SBBP repeat-containing protein [Deltaproteobacteria bacterium]